KARPRADDAGPLQHRKLSPVGQTVSGRQRLPAGEPRKASQRKARRPARPSVRATSTWRPGDRVRWEARVGVSRRDLGDGHPEIVIGERVYRVRAAELA